MKALHDEGKKDPEIRHHYGHPDQGQRQPNDQGRNQLCLVDAREELERFERSEKQEGADQHQKADASEPPSL